MTAMSLPSTSADNAVVDTNKFLGMEYNAKTASVPGFTDYLENFASKKDMDRIRDCKFDATVFDGIYNDRRFIANANARLYQAYTVLSQRALTEQTSVGEPSKGTSTSGDVRNWEKGSARG